MIEDRDLTDRLARLASAVPVRGGLLDPVHAGAVAARQQLRLRWLTPLVVIVILAMLGGVVGVGPLTTILNGPISATTKVGDFELTLRSAKAMYRNREPVVLTATLTYTGPRPSVHITHASSPMTFGIVEPVRGVLLNGGWAMSCGGSSLQRGVGLAKPFAKTFGSPVPIPLDAEAFVREPKLRLPPGTWHPYVVAEFSLGQCGAPHISMRTELAIEVLAGPAWQEDTSSTARPSPTPVPEDKAIHVVNLDPASVEIVFRNRVMEVLECGESTVISSGDLESSWPWLFIVRTTDDETIGATTVDWHLPQGILVRDGAVLTGPWPISYGPASGGCDATAEPSGMPTPTPSRIPNPPQVSTEADGDFAFVLTSDKSVYRPDEPINIEARLTYRGSAETVLISHPSGLFSFKIFEKVFDQIQVGGISDLMCGQATLVRDEPVISPFRKSGGIPSGRPDQARLLAWMQDPVLRLPVGTWHITASAGSPCLGPGAEFHVGGELTIVVSDDPNATPGLPRATD